MAASEAAVTAVMETLGCASDQCEDPFCSCQDDGGCREHGEHAWTERGCPVAVKIADAAVDADRASIQAEALREAAGGVGAGPAVAEHLSRGTVAAWLCDRADRIEARP